MENLDYAIRVLQDNEHKVKKEIGEVGWFMPSCTKSKLAEAASLKAAIEILENYKQLNKLS